ncbi:globin domain-containing protein [Streptomyces sp. Je 1-369]|uniref:globin domain-containing protein n=1 Tax=Streptomyces sp. Je 1-369 TaxID=2966192 RepID=UPI002286656E|nr:globin domain-containing protein [Streptomyces sp. Je 1-369]WAL95147.1 FAD-binding oxidoreductase [Streptomyces sp. Je 1-369]
MLSEQSAATVRATLPVVGAAIGEITERFYDRLFTAHPELLRDLFNRGNQAAGTQRQALAGSIAAFATHLVEHPDERPDVMLNRIAHKHASLGVAPDQYATVHHHLFAAIVEVLGDAVTPDVAAAWDDVYWLMANALIAIEARLYAGQGVTAGSGEATWREWEVVGRVEETEDVATFRLRPADGAAAPGFRPGQYVSVQVQLADGARQIRQYSLTGAGSGGSGSGGSEVRQICVKRVRGEVGTPDGEVSNHLHARVREGDVLRVSAPYGDLVLGGTGAHADADADADADAPLLLASAGIGVTPMIAMLEQLAASGHRAPVTVVHADRSPAEHALRADHEAYTAKLPNGSAYFFYERPETGHPAELTGYADLAALPAIPAGTRAYLCGPLPFMRAVRSQLLERGVAAADIHYEVFGPDLWLARS